jgi:PAS domain S-box-containing protein
MTKPINILAIEDSESDAALNIRALEHAGYEVAFELVDTADGMKDALNSGDFDIVLSDHNLPQFGSAAALALLKATCRDIPFIIVSGAIGEETAVELMKAGAQDYVIKGNLSRLAPAVERELKDAEARRERKRSAEKLRESEERFSRVVEIADEMIWEVNSEMLYLYVNPVSEIVTGYKPEEFIGKKYLFDLAPQEVREGYKAVIRDTYKNKTTIKGITSPCVRKDGRVIILETSATPMLDEKGDLIGFRGTGTDITERKNMEARIEELYQSEKVHRQTLQEEAEVKNIFIDVLAHELRNSLTSVVVSSDILHETPVLSDEMRNKLVKNISEGAKLLAKRLDELLDLARYSKGTLELKLQTIDVWEFIEQVVSRYKLNFEKRNQTLVFEIGGGLKLFKLDKSRVEQVIINLLSNAGKYSPEGSEIIMKAKVENSGLLIEVSDKGVGISLEDQNNLFQPYYRVGKNKGIPGVGLGLAVSKKIIEAHGGQISITSQLGQGSTFSINIPNIPWTRFSDVLFKMDWNFSIQRRLSFLRGGILFERNYF